MKITQLQISKNVDGSYRVAISKTEPERHAASVPQLDTAFGTAVLAGAYDRATAAIGRGQAPGQAMLESVCTCIEEWALQHLEQVEGITQQRARGAARS